MISNDIFEYESDWVENFNAVLKNEIRDEIDNRNAIKANIIESNQNLNDFVKRYDYLELIPSKEDFFHNIRIKNKKNFYFYINNKNPRFWVVHNIEKQEVFKKTSPVKWHCINCGYVMESEEAPKECPACKHPQAYYELLAENY